MGFKGIFISLQNSDLCCGNYLGTHCATFYFFCSLNDRRPITSDDEVVVLVVPDYQMIAEVQKIASSLSEDPEMMVCIF